MKIAPIILLTLAINLIGHNLHPYFGSLLFYYCEYINYTIFYLLLGKLFDNFWVRFTCGIGVVFCFNDIIDLATNPYISKANEWVICIMVIYLWYTFLKMVYDGNTAKKPD